MTRWTTLLVALTVGGFGCKDEPNPCDSTSYLSGSDCLPKTDAALPEPDAEAPTEAAAPAVDSEGASLLGQPCTDNVTHAECQGPDTDYCAIQPGEPGYCTKSGCATAADCPPKWTCFNLGMGGIPPMCTKPAGQ
jgi:hypothetical protein